MDKGCDAYVTNYFSTYRKRKISHCPETADKIFLCVISTPLGVPVLPLVYMINAKSSGFTESCSSRPVKDAFHIHLLKFACNCDLLICLFPLLFFFLFRLIKLKNIEISAVLRHSNNFVPYKLTSIPSMKNYVHWTWFFPHLNDCFVTVNALSSVHKFLRWNGLRTCGVLRSEMYDGFDEFQIFRNFCNLNVDSNCKMEVISWTKKKKNVTYCMFEVVCYLLMASGFSKEIHPRLHLIWCGSGNGVDSIEACTLILLSAVAFSTFLCLS